MNDYDCINMDNEWVVGIRHTGDQGFEYVASHIGVLWASGWVRCATVDVARQLALSAGRVAMDAADRSHVTARIPADLVGSVVHGIMHTAEFYRRDKGHDPEDLVSLNRDADRLDEIAEAIQEAR